MGLTGKASAMTIKAFSDPDHGSALGEVELPFKPKSLTMKMGNRINGFPLINGSSGVGQYQGGDNAELNVTFLLNTVMQENLISLVFDTLSDQVQKITKLLYSMNSDTHESSFLQVKWAGLPMGLSTEGAFSCRLVRMDVDYTNIDDDGEPQEAEIHCRFVECLSDKTRLQRESKNSPDLTHIRPVIEQDSLPWKTWDIYRDPAYLIGVAEVNGLDSLRNLKPGESLIFPPLEK